MTQVGIAKEKNLMAATWTRAAKVRRSFKAGRQRQKDLVLTSTRAVLEGHIVLHEIQTAMREAGLAEEDVRAALVLVTEEGTHDLITVIRFPAVEELGLMLRKIKELEGVWRPLGLVFGQTDREAMVPGDPNGGATVWVQPWLTDPRSARALIAARNAVTAGKEGKQQFS